MRATPLLVAAILALAADARAQECGVPLDLYDAPLVADLRPRPTLDALEQGNLAVAAALARDALPVARLARDVARNRVRPGRAFGEDDLRAALAVAVVRTGGAEGLLRATTDARQQRKNLAQAHALLQAQARIHAGDPVVTTYLGEALVAVGRDDEARALLEDLAAADLIVSAEGWAALAAVADADADLAAHARTRCGAMARDPAACLQPIVLAGTPRS